MRLNKIQTLQVCIKSKGEKAVSNYGHINGVGMKILVCALGLTVMATVLVPGIPRHAIFPELDRFTNPSQHRTNSPDTLSITPSKAEVKTKVVPVFDDCLLGQIPDLPLPNHHASSP